MLRVLLLQAVLFAVIGGTWTPPEITVAGGFNTTLRKLHLVRPDLLPYPLYVEVYC